MYNRNQDGGIGMNAKNVSMVGRLIPGMVLGFLVLLMLILLGDMNEVTRIMSQFNWRYLPVVLLLTLLNYFIRILKWHFSLGRSGPRHLSFANSAQLFMAAFPLTLSQGQVSEAIKGIWLKQKNDMPVGRSTQVLAADQISDWLAVIALAILGVVAYPAYWPVFLIVLITLLAIVIFGKDPVANDSWGGIDHQFPALTDALARLRQVFTGGLSLYRPFPGLLAFVLGVLSWLGEGVCMYLILLGAGLEANFQLLAVSIWIVALSTLIGVLSGLPGGLGAIEVALATSLTIFTGLPPAVATVATVLFRLATLWFKVVIGIIVWRFSPGLSGLRSKSGTIVEN
jgi:glycosyltransferase 2 family protein